MAVEFVPELKAQINIVSVVGEYVRLKKMGTNYVGLCPFHSERSPSFSVSEKRQIFHCFGCSKGGDVITFIQNIQEVSFKEALLYLANKFGVAVPKEMQQQLKQQLQQAETSDRHQILYKLNQFTAQFYHESLFSVEGLRAREYLQSRGISEESMRKFYLGWASTSWDALASFLIEKKAPIDVALELGLIRSSTKNAGRYYDFFRNRVLFPVLDEKGRVVGFGGRALPASDGDDGAPVSGETASDEIKVPKYLNSAESPIFHKHSQLFGLFTAQKDIRERDFCLLVEGYLDCIALQQAGLGPSVAVLGTALGREHLKALKKLTPNLVLVFDGDAAGQAASFRSLDAFLDEDILPKVVVLPPGVDPDDYIRQDGVAALEQRVLQAESLLDVWVVQQLQGAHTLDQQAKALDTVLPKLARLKSSSAIHLRLSKIASILNADINYLVKRTQELRPQIQIKGRGSAGSGDERRSVNYSSVGRRSAQVSVFFDPIDLGLLELLFGLPAQTIAFYWRALFGEYPQYQFSSVVAGLRSSLLQSLFENDLFLVFLKKEARILLETALDHNCDSLQDADQDLSGVLRIYLRNLLDHPEQRPADLKDSKLLIHSVKSLRNLILNWILESDSKSFDLGVAEAQYQDFKCLALKLIRRGVEIRRDKVRADIVKLEMRQSGVPLEAAIATQQNHTLELSKLLQDYQTLTRELSGL